MIVVTQGGAAHLLEKGIDGLTATTQIHLYQNDIAPSPSTLLADFVEATFDGYAAPVVTPASWPIFLQGISQAVAVGPAQVFSPTGNVTPNVIYGYYVTDNTGARLLWAERFAEPKVMNGVTTGFTLVPAIGGQSAAG